MITNLGSGQWAVLASLASSPHTFTLTGSRNTSYHSPSADYDFYVEDSQEVRQFLHNAGFTKISYYDSLDYAFSLESQGIVYILRHSSGVDVQLIRPKFMMAKHYANRVMQNFGSLPKRVRSALWHTLILEYVV